MLLRNTSNCPITNRHGETHQNICTVINAAVRTSNLAIQTKAKTNRGRTMGFHAHISCSVSDKSWIFRDWKICFTNFYLHVVWVKCPKWTA
jgi:hypothetical protein